MANKDLFAQAIADAKKLKEISMANAKQAIEEAFAPRIQEMFRMKLSEMEDTLEEDDMDTLAGVTDDAANDIMEDEMGEGKQEPQIGEEMNEMTLEEILAELELEEGEEPAEEAVEPLEEAKDEEEEAEDTEEEAEDDEAAEEAEEEVEGEETVAEVDLDTLVSRVADAVINALNAKEGEVENLEAGAEEEIPGGDTEGVDGAISLDEILAELQEEEDILAEAKKKGKVAPKKEDEKKKKEHEKKEDEKEEKKKLKEAVDTIEVLKSELNEINLLNAKLLYVNKIFKSKSLSEAQKVKVITAFDRATTITETKNIYATLNDSLTAAQAVKKAPLKESLGFASKPIGSAPARPIVEADAYVHRMQQLAGLRQPNI